MEQRLQDPDTIYKPRKSEDANSSQSPGSQHNLDSKQGAKDLLSETRRQGFGTLVQTSSITARTQNLQQ